MNHNLTSMTFLWICIHWTIVTAAAQIPFPQIASPPVNMFHQEQLEEHAFPVLYPRGRFGLGYDRSTPITDLKYSSCRCRDPGHLATCVLLSPDGEAAALHIRLKLALLHMADNTPSHQESGLPHLYKFAYSDLHHNNNASRPPASSRHKLAC
jgi:hypothetical protein